MSSNPRSSAQVKNRSNSDPADEIKRRARRRLVGSLALFLTALIVVPALIEGEPQSQRPEIELVFPNKPTSPVTKADDAAVDDRVVAPPSDLPKEELASLPKLKADHPVTESSPPAQPPAVPAPVPASKPEPRSETQADLMKALEGKPEGPANKSPVEKKLEAAKEPPKDTPKDTLKEPPKNAVNKESTKDTHKEAVKDAPKVVSKDSTKDHANEAHKEKAKPAVEEDPISKFAKAEPSKPEPPKADAPAKPSYVQIAALKDADRAEELRKELASKGFSSKVEAITTDQGKVYRVRIGPVADADKADKTKADLAKQGYNARVVQ